jgi:hypothetical protein
MISLRSSMNDLAVCLQWKSGGEGPQRIVAAEKHRFSGILK